MCFGSSKQTSTSTTPVPRWMEEAGQQNYQRALEAVQSPNYRAYEGDRVAGLSGDQTAAFDWIRSLSGSTNPYTGMQEGLLTDYASTPAGQITLQSILGGGVSPSDTSIESYISPYVQGALNPVLDQIARRGMQERQAIDAQATGAGAFGDARHGIVEARQRADERQLAADTTAKAYQSAFDTATQLRGQDVRNLMAGDEANARLMETALGRLLSGAEGFGALDQNAVNRLLQIAQAQANAGATQQGVAQKELDAKKDYFEETRDLPIQGSQLLQSILAGSPYTKTTTETKSGGDSGPGQLIGAALGAILSDRRMKENIVQVGELFDGTPVYQFNYTGGRTTHIGLMADEVEERIPDAVIEIEGVKYVDYALATAGARALAEGFDELP